MFKKMFGGDKKPEKKEEPKVTAPQQPLNSSEIDFENTLLKVRTQEQAFEVSIEKYSQRIETVRAQAKEYLRTGQTKKVKSCLAETRLLEQHIENQENQKMVFLKIRIQLESGKTNKQSANTLKQAVETLKTIDTNVIEDAMDDLQEIDATQKEVAGMFKQMAATDQDDTELDEEVAKLQKEIDDEKTLQLEKDLNKVPGVVLNGNTNQQKLPNAPQQQQAQKVVAPQQNNKFNDALLDQLMD